MFRATLFALLLCSASSLILIGCATPSPRPVPVEPDRPDPRLCAPLELEPPVLGSIVAPVTAEEREATRAHLTSEAEARAWGRRGWERSAIARAPCDR